MVVTVMTAQILDPVVLVDRVTVVQLLNVAQMNLIV
jgi:hypothetical protein